MALPKVSGNHCPATWDRRALPQADLLLSAELPENGPGQEHRLPPRPALSDLTAPQGLFRVLPGSRLTVQLHQTWPGNPSWMVYITWSSASPRTPLQAQLQHGEGQGQGDGHTLAVLV